MDRGSESERCEQTHYISLFLHPTYISSISYVKSDRHLPLFVSAIKITEAYFTYNNLIAASLSSYIQLQFLLFTMNFSICRLAYTRRNILANRKSIQTSDYRYSRLFLLCFPLFRIISPLTNSVRGPFA